MFVPLVKELGSRSSKSGYGLDKLDRRKKKQDQDQWWVLWWSREAACVVAVDDTSAAVVVAVLACSVRALRSRPRDEREVIETWC